MECGLTKKTRSHQNLLFKVSHGRPLAKRWEAGWYHMKKKHPYKAEKDKVPPPKVPPSVEAGGVGR